MKWSETEIEILKNNYKTKPHREIEKLLSGRTLKAIATKLKKLGSVKELFRWSESQIQYLKDNYADNHSQKIADQLGLKVEAVWHKAHQLGLKKSKDWVAANAKANMERPNHPGKLTQFKKGQRSWNKGKKGLRFAGSEKGYFPKGNRPHNSMEIGTESFVDGYWKVKIAEPNIWKLKQRLVWESYYGEIPANHVVIFKDRNTSNFTIENLELVSRRELRIRNSLHNQYSPDMRSAIYTLSGLKRRITTIKRRKQNAEKQNG